AAQTDRHFHPRDGTARIAGGRRRPAAGALERRAGRPGATGRRAGTLMVRGVGALLALALVSSPVRAAPPEPPARDRARTYLMLRLVDALDLPDDKALALRTIFRKHPESRVALLSSRQALDKQLRAALGRPEKDSNDLARLVAALNTVHRALAA